MEKKSPRLKALLTPGEVAKRSGVAVSALHFYESKGLITSIRNSGNQRRYKRGRVALCRDYQDRPAYRHPAGKLSATRLVSCRKDIR